MLTGESCMVQEFKNLPLPLSLRIKSPIFDLFLAFAIALYIALWYLMVEVSSVA